MSDDADPLVALEREKARIMEDAKAQAAAIDQKIANHLASLASKYGFALTPLPAAPAPQNLTIEELDRRYRNDPDSPYHAIRFSSREHTDSLCRAVVADIGPVRIADIKADDLLAFHRTASERVAARGRGDGKAMAESLVGQLRTLLNYGGRALSDNDCARASFILRDLREQMGLKFAKSRNVERSITAEQTVAIRRMANLTGNFSIALAQAIQFDTPFRQREVIGEWIPSNEPGEPILTSGDMKWIRGLCWENISRYRIRHAAGKAGASVRVIDVDLQKCPMVMEELINKFGSLDALPEAGPVIVNEETDLPYRSPAFRARWRMIAREAKVPDEVTNRASHSGKVTMLPKPNGSRVNGHAIPAEEGDEGWLLELAETLAWRDEDNEAPTKG